MVLIWLICLFLASPGLSLQRSYSDNAVVDHTARWNEYSAESTEDDSESEHFEAEIFPEEIEEFAYDANLSITLNIVEEYSDLSLKFRSTRDDVASILMPKSPLTIAETPANITIKMIGVFLGYSTLEVLNASDDQILITKEIPVARPEVYEKWEIPIEVIERTIIGFSGFVLGTQLALRDLLDCIRRPYWLIVGLVIQNTVMPLLGYAWGYLFMHHLHDERALFLGLFMVACSPSGFEANYYSLAMSPNRSLSMTLSVFSNVLGIGTMSLWIYTLGNYKIYNPLPNHSDLVGMLIATIFNILLPLFGGMVLRYFKPELVERREAIWEKFSRVLSLVLLIWSSIVNRYMFTVEQWYHFVSLVLVPLTGIIVCFAICILLGSSRQNAWTISASSAVLNAELASLVIVSGDFLPQPDKDLAKVMPALLVLYYPLVISIIRVVLWVLYKLGYDIMTPEDRAAVKAAKREGSAKKGRKTFGRHLAGTEEHAEKEGEQKF